MPVVFEDAVVLVTGSNGGLGKEFVHESLERGARRVYATARHPREWNDDRIVALSLDVNDPQSIANAATVASDTTIMVNNAGAFAGGSLLNQPFDEIRALFETNVFGAIGMVRAFAPVLARNGGGAVLDVHSVLSWTSFPGGGAYGATKAAFWAATNAFRLELAPQGTLVTGLHLGYTDTPMIDSFDVDKNSPIDVVRAAFDGIAAGEYEVLADSMTTEAKRLLSLSIHEQFPSLPSSFVES